MTKNLQSISNNGEVLDQRQGHHTPVMLVMNDFLALRFVLFFPASSFLKFMIAGTFGISPYLVYFFWVGVKSRMINARVTIFTEQFKDPV